jgi:hypothetical protein
VTVNQKRTYLCVIAAGMLAAGCASNKPEAKPEPTPAPVVKADNSPKASYVVKKGDSLWKIASKKKVLGDPFAWPLIFKANRDQIQDPDFIDVHEDLSYKKNYSTDELADAKEKAEQTPPFEPRKQPRKVLPIQY